VNEEALEVGEPVTVDDVVIRPIARRRIVGGTDGTAGGVVALLRPMGVIVEEGDDTRTLDLDGVALAEDLLDEVPDIDVEP
jgi:uncharacterized spore protein YtfJ